MGDVLKFRARPRVTLSLPWSRRIGSEYLEADSGGYRLRVSSAGWWIYGFDGLIQQGPPQGSLAETCRVCECQAAAEHHAALMELRE